jgi:transmembrane sensor
MNEVVIPYGKKSELLLADGTKVWLNAGSRLAFPIEVYTNTREIYLEGEACFEVAKNEKILLL